MLELLIILAIIVLLTVFALPSYNYFRANSEMNQKAGEIKELILQAYNMAQNPETGVTNYIVIFDDDISSSNHNSIILARDMTADAQADPRDWIIKPENFVKKISLGTGRSISCPNLSPSTSTKCGVMICPVGSVQKQEETCVLLTDNNNDYYNLEGDTPQYPYDASSGLYFRINDFNTNPQKFFFWDGLNDTNRFEINGLKTTIEEIN